MAPLAVSRVSSAGSDLPPRYQALRASIAARLPSHRVIADPLRLLAWGTDASFYRLIPKLAIVADNEDEVSWILTECARFATPVTFRAAGTSLSGQAVTDSVLLLLSDNWRRCEIAAGAGTITLQPAVIGAEANRRLAPFRRKIGPDPASIDTAKIGGIAGNNASGMCCGTAMSSYRTVAGMRVVLADGSVLDTRDPASRGAFAARRPDLLAGLRDLASATQDNAALADRIRHKYRLKNTTGYSLNALVDFRDPFDILSHLMIGSEGTLGFISEITYRTVPEHADKASALILFDTLATACRAVTALKAAPVAAVELADRAALRSVQDKPGMPQGIRGLGPDGAALLVETRAADPAALGAQIRAVEGALTGLATAEPIAFSADPAECARFWNVRKGMFPSVGAVRRAGTTVIIEDVAFPVERLAEATLDLQQLLSHHGYPEAIIFGHALEGNLHFVFTQDFGAAAEIERYRGFMDALCRMVVQKYDGSLKAEHGTGRNVAPFVELEWGAEAYALMRRIKQLFDPHGLLNPGVLINGDPGVHLQNLKPMPQCDPLVDKCIECGFCEPQCPSHGLTLSPRQRIVGWREIARLNREAPGSRQVGALRRLYDYQGIDTCAACGLCRTACPVDIETGLLTKSLRRQRHGAFARGVADAAADHFVLLTTGLRAGLAMADAAHAVLGTPLMRGTARVLRSASGGRLPKWSPAMPRPARVVPIAPVPGPDAPRPDSPRPDAPRPDSPRVVYFPSCVARTMGPQRGDNSDPLPAVAERLFRKAGFGVVYPPGMASLCCGQAFESKGLLAAADRKAAELEAALRDASEGGRWPIAFDTSPCALRMRRFCGDRLPVQDSIDFIHDAVLPRVSLTPVESAVAIHPVCSVRHLGLTEKLMTLARACSSNVVTAPDVLCCGFAGDKGFNRPELNDYALRRLKQGLPPGCAAGFSTSRTCEIGLSEHAGFPYRSIVHLVEACAAAK